jgi:hypothetical protein
MNENTVETVGQIDLFTGEVVEETPEMVLEDIVKEIVGEKSEYTAYSIATIINKVFEATLTDKKIPTQMMYQYTRNGMIVKGKKGAASEIRYTVEEVNAFVNKYTSKHVDI